MTLIASCMTEKYDITFLVSLEIIMVVYSGLDSAYFACYIHYGFEETWRWYTGEDYCIVSD